MDRILPLFRFAEVKAESDKKAPDPEVKKIWPRLLFFGSFSQDCDDDLEETSEKTPPGGSPTDNEAIMCVDEEEEEEDDECEEENRRKGPSKLSCMYHGARYGLREGALTGIFFGGALGIYKYLGGYLKGEKDEGSSDEDSSVNENVIFVTAANGAIAMAVFCTLFCSTKAMIYCS